MEYGWTPLLALPSVAMLPQSRLLLALKLFRLERLQHTHGCLSITVGCCALCMVEFKDLVSVHWAGNSWGQP